MSRAILASLIVVLATSAVPAADWAVVAGEGLREPFAIDWDSAGRAYVAEMSGHRISVLEKTGGLRVLAGTGEPGLEGDGGPAAKARFKSPHHLLVGPEGHLYIADTGNHAVRKIDLSTGLVSRVAGTGERGFSGDGGPALLARFGGIYAIAFRGRVLYVCDLDNRRVRAVDLSTGLVTTVAGNGEKGIPKDGEDARSQPLVDPRAIALDSSGNLYILERGGHALRVVNAAGRIRTVAGTGEAGFSGDGGPALAARFDGPKHISVDPEDRVLIVDTENHAIRRYSPRDGTVRLVAGTGLLRPHGAVTEPGTGAIVVSDSGHDRVVRLEKTPR